MKPIIEAFCPSFWRLLRYQICRISCENFRSYM